MASTTPSLARRLLWTLLAPAALLLVGPRILVPGVDPSAFGANTDLRNLSVFAIGLMPIVLAYALVELVAIAIPPLSRWRHDQPARRLTLERVALVLGLAFAAFSAFGTASSLAHLINDDPVSSRSLGYVSIPVTAASLLGGVCVMLIVARFITRQGIVNGIVLITVLDTVDGSIRELAANIAKRRLLDELSPLGLLGFGAVIVASLVGVWVALRESPSAAADTTPPGGDPYRKARALALRPTVPVPASALAPMFFASAVMSLPNAMAGFSPGMKAISEWLSNVDTWQLLLAQWALTLLLVVTFARLIHRPGSMADLVARLGGADRREAEANARQALRRSLPATLLFFTMLVAASGARGALQLGWSQAQNLPLFVALGIDIVVACRAFARTPDLVSVWHERRPSAVPVLRAALESEGISVRTTGTAVLRLLQVFGPYAYGDILVPTADAPRASALLKHLLLGEEAPPREPIAAAASRSGERAPAPRRTTMVLAVATVAILVIGGAATFGRAVAKAAPLSERPKLEVIRVDDSIDALGSVDTMKLPDGLDLRIENVPLGPGKAARRTFVSTKLAPGETIGAARERAQAFTRTVKLPADARFAFEPTEDYDSETGMSTVDGVRSFVLRGETILTTADVVRAEPAVQDQSGYPQIYVAVELGSEGAQRFADATDEWTNRRIAILVDGMINSAPVVRTRITGGRMSIMMGMGDADRILAAAKELAHGLTGRRTAAAR